MLICYEQVAQVLLFFSTENAPLPHQVPAQRAARVGRGAGVARCSLCLLVRRSAEQPLPAAEVLVGPDGAFLCFKSILLLSASPARQLPSPLWPRPTQPGHSRYWRGQAASAEVQNLAEPQCSYL